MDSRNIYRGSMDDNVMKRTRQLIAEIERELPEFVNACKAAGAAFILIDQDAFALTLGPMSYFFWARQSSTPGWLGRK